MAEKVTKAAEEKVTKTTKAPAKKTTKKIPANKAVEFTATGRRKNSIARVRLVPNGKGQFVINKKHIEEYFVLGQYRLVANQALELTGTQGKYDVFVNVCGGGLSGQAGVVFLLSDALNHCVRSPAQVCLYMRKEVSTM